MDIPQDSFSRAQYGSVWQEPLSHFDRGLELKLFGNPRGLQEIDFLPSVDAGLGSHVTLSPFGAGERVSLDICLKFVAIESAVDKTPNRIPHCELSRELPVFAW